MKEAVARVEELRQICYARRAPPSWPLSGSPHELDEAAIEEESSASILALTAPSSALIRPCADWNLNAAFSPVAVSERDMA